MRDIIKKYRIFKLYFFVMSLFVIFPVPIFSESEPSKLSLEQIHSLSLPQRFNENIIRSQFISTQDLFTQSQAHMSVPEVKKLIDTTYDIKPYEKLIKTIIDQEKIYADKYVFYHGMDNVWRVPQDVYTRLYIHFNKLPKEIGKDFIFLRFENMPKITSIKDFLIQELRKDGLVNDHSKSLFMIATNLALFGNTGISSECTWEYFIKSRKHLAPNRDIYEKILRYFGFSNKYVDKLMELVKEYKTNEQTILQIFIPKEKVDLIGYLSWIRGIPAHQETMNTVLRKVEDKTFAKTAPALDHYAQIFKNEGETNIIFKNLIERIKAGEYHLGYFLHFYRNKPNEIQGINNYQARLIFTPDVLLNPFSGVKIFRYSMATSDQLKKYRKKLDSLIDKILSEKKL